MTLNLSMPNKAHEIKPRITVVGVGGAGGNAVNNMIRSNLEGVEFIVSNTDSQALAQSLCERRLQLGTTITQGLGAGSRPDVGRAAAEESLESVIENLSGSNMAFITAGMGGGTGTGAAPVIARAAREHGILTVGVITKPFHFEGMHRMAIAESGIEELQQYVDTLIIIPNQNLFRIANEKTTFADAFAMADQVLYSGVRGVTDLMVMPGLINLDFADIRAVMTEMGKAMMGTGEASGDNRAIDAAEAAISNPLLDDVSMKGARGVLINITGGPDLTLFEVDAAATRIREEVDPDANIIFGSTFDESLDGKVRISVVATGIEAMASAMPRPSSLALVADRGRVTRTPAQPVGEAVRRPQPAPVVAAARPMAEAAPMPEPVVASIEMPAELPVEQPVETARPAAAQDAVIAAESHDEQRLEPIGEPAAEQYDPIPQLEPMAPANQPRIAVEPEVAADLPRRPAFLTHAPVVPPLRAERAELSPQPAMAPAPAARTADGGPAAEARRISNLFSRVTGTTALFGRGAPARTETAAPAAERPAPRESVTPAPRMMPATTAAPAAAQARVAMPAARSAAAPQPTMQQPVSQPMSAAPMAATAQAAVQPQPAPAMTAPAMTAPAIPPVQQQRLSGLDARERIATSRTEEAQLDIPAFLRRQAN
ncbi:MAG: cell division protein FtsZ [Dongiaceae bacterium]